MRRWMPRTNCRKSTHLCTFRMTWVRRKGPIWRQNIMSESSRWALAGHRYSRLFLKTPTMSHSPRTCLIMGCIRSTLRLWTKRIPKLSSASPLTLPASIRCGCSTHNSCPWYKIRTMSLPVIQTVLSPLSTAINISGPTKSSQFSLTNKSARSSSPSTNATLMARSWSPLPTRPSPLQYKLNNSHTIVRSTFPRSTLSEPQPTSQLSSTSKLSLIKATQRWWQIKSKSLHFPRTATKSLTGTFPTATSSSSPPPTRELSRLRLLTTSGTRIETLSRRA